jgi:RimJ/RimL family protein N-acetyltransferase
MPDQTDFLIRRLENAQVKEIREWPPYPEEFHLLDYALRPGGWLDMFPESASVRRFGAWSHGELVGFSLLTEITKEQAEFYIALHPRHTREGFGRLITCEILGIAFGELGLQSVYLKVREWHARAIALYRDIGFVATGKKVEEIQGQTVHFSIMEISREEFPAGASVPPAR